MNKLSPSLNRIVLVSAALLVLIVAQQVAAQVPGQGAGSAPVTVRNTDNAGCTGPKTVEM